MRKEIKGERQWERGKIEGERSEKWERDVSEKWKGVSTLKKRKNLFQVSRAAKFYVSTFLRFRKKNVLRLSFFVSSFNRSQKYQFHVWSEIEMQHKSFGFLELLPKTTSEWPLNCFKTQTLKSSHTQSCSMWQYSI